MKIISWNVNGIRSILKKSFLDFFKQRKPDILCLQEIKLGHEMVEIETKGYHQFWYPAEKPGYSGTAIFTKEMPISVKRGMGIEKHDSEGRVLTAEYKHFFLVNVYVPKSKRDLSRLNYREKEWDVDLLKYLKKLNKKKAVVMCGDLNVAYEEIDLANPKSNLKNSGFTPEERKGFGNILKSGFVDAFRVFYQTNGHYTWWSNRNNCRERNIGWRLDYFCISSELSPRLKSATILKDVLGSDHCPILIELKP